MQFHQSWMVFNFQLQAAWQIFECTVKVFLCQNAAMQNVWKRLSMCRVSSEFKQTQRLYPEDPSNDPWATHYRYKSWRAQCFQSETKSWFGSETRQETTQCRVMFKIVFGFASRSEVCMFFLQSIYKGHDCKPNCSEGWQIHEHRDGTSLFHYSDETPRGRFEMWLWPATLAILEAAECWEYLFILNLLQWAIINPMIQWYKWSHCHHPQANVVSAIEKQAAVGRCNHAAYAAAISVQCGCIKDLWLPPHNLCSGRR